MGTPITWAMLKGSVNFEMAMRVHLQHMRTDDVERIANPVTYLVWCGIHVSQLGADHPAAGPLARGLRSCLRLLLNHEEERVHIDDGLPRVRSPVGGAFVSCPRYPSLTTPQRNQTRGWSPCRGDAAPLPALTISELALQRQGPRSGRSVGWVRRRRGLPLPARCGKAPGLLTDNAIMQTEVR